MQRTHTLWTQPLAASIALCGLWFLTQPLTAGIVINNFDDIDQWTGSGANRAALVIDWADGRQPLAWGYRFDTATGQDMLRAVVEADSRLYAKVQDFGGSLGWFTHGLGYDRDGAGFTVSTGSNFGASGLLFSADYDAATATAPDSYRETNQPFTHTWGYWNGSGYDYPGAGWSEASTGPGGRQLADQAWDGFQFNALGFGNGQPPGTAFTAIPEPGGMLFVALLAVRCFGRRRTAYSQPWATAL